MWIGFLIGFAIGGVFAAIFTGAIVDEWWRNKLKRYHGQYVYWNDDIPYEIDPKANDE